MTKHHCENPGLWSNFRIQWFDHLPVREKTRHRCVIKRIGFWRSIWTTVQPWFWPTASTFALLLQVWQHKTNVGFVTAILCKVNLLIQRSTSRGVGWLTNRNRSKLFCYTLSWVSEVFDRFVLFRSSLRWISCAVTSDTKELILTRRSWTRAACWSRHLIRLFHASQRSDNAACRLLPK